MSARLAKLKCSRLHSPGIALYCRVNSNLVIGLELEFGSCRSSNGICAEICCRSLKVDVLKGGVSVEIQQQSWAHNHQDGACLGSDRQ